MRANLRQYQTHLHLVGKHGTQPWFVKYCSTPRETLPTSTRLSFLLHSIQPQFHSATSQSTNLVNTADMHVSILLFSLTLMVGIALSAALPDLAVPPVCGTINVSSPRVEDKPDHTGCVFFGEPCGKSASVSVDEFLNEAKTAAQRTLKLYGGSVCYDIQGDVQSYEIVDPSCQCEFFR